VQEPEDVLGAARELAARGTPRESPEVDTWTDVAERLVSVYRGVARDWPGEARG
jgi:hypothetical protein